MISLYHCFIKIYFKIFIDRYAQRHFLFLLFTHQDKKLSFHCSITLDLPELSYGLTELMYAYLSPTIYLHVYNLYDICTSPIVNILVRIKANMQRIIKASH